MDVNERMSPAVLTTTEVVPATARAAAFRRLTDSQLDASYRLAQAILNNGRDAEDAVHDACVAAWTQWSTLRDPKLFDRWFQRIVVNTCRNRLRRAARVRVIDVSPELTSAERDEFIATDRRADLGSALARLAPDDQVVLALRYYRDLAIDDIGHALGIPSGTVKSRIHNALRRLHDVIDDGDPGEALR